ncbi:MAG: hypothetical protein VB021_02375 [Oscillospiraceae bacterium]|nr:hypothetical protein [Oscillospiraceae bacterium]
MKNLFSKIKNALRNGLTEKQFAWTVFALVLFKLALCAVQMLHIYPGETPIDDDWLFAAAKSIGEGRWLGDYNWLTLTKNMFFSVWIWLLHTLRIPYLIGNQLLYLAGCLVLVRALDGFIVKGRSRLLLVFAVVWFSPYSWATETLRIYRDSIMPQLVLLFFAGMLGFCLRCRQPAKNAAGFAVAAGLGFGLAYITKDDGVWLLPFAGCAALAFLLFVFLDKEQSLRQKAAKLLITVLFAACAYAPIGAYSAMNYIYYGRYITTEISAPEFVNALNAMRRADTDLPHTGNFVCYATRQKLSAAVPSMAALDAYLDDGDYYHGYGDPDTREFVHGGFFFMVKKAAYDAGFATTAAEAQTYFTQLAADINAACDSGLIETDQPDRDDSISGMLTPYDPSYLAPTLRECLNSLRALMLFEQTSPFAPLSYATPEQASEYHRYFYCLSSYSAKAGTDEADYYFVQRVTGGIQIGITWLYRIAVWPALACFFLFFARRIRAFFRDRRERGGPQGLFTVLLLGILLSILLRVGIVSYVEAVNFHIGTQLHYLTGAGVLLIVCCALGAEAALRTGGKKAP